MSAGEERHWKVGELARATGLTVRALHHYDDVGLLVPSERTSGNHRLYSEHDVRRLYGVIALRRLGLGLDEIAALLDDDRVGLVETVRRHLAQVERELEHQHLLRERLRRMLEALEHRVEPSAEEFIDALEAMTMIEVNVEDVLIQLSAEEVDEPPPRLAREGYRMVHLKERGGERVLPIWIGAQEGDLLAARLGEWSQNRPMSPDLTAQLLKAGGARVERVVIEGIRERTYYATVTVAAGGESHEVDARPSDALNLALRVGAPVLVAPEVIDQAGVPSGVIASRLNDPAAGPAAQGWHSLSADLVRSLYPREASIGWERYSREAFQVMTNAREEARSCGHDYVGSKHVVVGLLLEKGSVAANVLDSLGVTLERAPGRLMHRSDEQIAPGFLPYGETTQKTLELALREEGTRRPNVVGAEHILLGLVRADEGALRDLGVDVERVPEEVCRARQSLARESPSGEAPHQ